MALLCKAFREVCRVVGRRRSFIKCILERERLCPTLSRCVSGLGAAFPGGSHDQVQRLTLTAGASA